jgi:predicted ATPase
MIRLIEALNYRCLRHVRQELGNFHVLVGPNASGKSTFLDVVAFLRILVTDGLDAAIEERTSDFRDLLWHRSGTHFELALDLEIPDQRRELLPPARDFTRVRYEVAVGFPPDEKEDLSILSERVLLKASTRTRERHIQRSLFPQSFVPPETITTSKVKKGTKTVVNKVPGGNDNFYAETGSGWDYAFKFRLGSRKSALANVPDDENKFPVATWLREVLEKGVQRMMLNSLAMRYPSPPPLRRGFAPDGSNLPWVVDSLQRQHPNRFKDWLDHVRTALETIGSIRSVERPEDKSRFLEVEYLNKVTVPSWMLSDGTLRLLALTILAYTPEAHGIWLIEEPENGIHPTGVQTVFDSLSSVYHGQVLLATHSPIILNLADPAQVLCFAFTDEGATDIVSGAEHPRLREWRGDENLGALFAAGILQ